MATLNRDHVIAAMLVTGVVVIVGFASGLGLRTTTSNAQTGAPAAAQAQPGVSTPLPEGGLPQAIQPPVMSMPGTDLPVSEPTGAAQPLPGDAGSVPSPAVTQPALPIVPGQPVAPPTTPGAPGAPGTPNSPGAPPTCLPGVAQQVADTANSVVAGLPVVGGLTGALGLTQAPDGSSPGALNTLLYAVTGYCAPSDPATSAPVEALPKAGG